MEATVNGGAIPKLMTLIAQVFRFADYWLVKVSGVKICRIAKYSGSRMKYIITYDTILIEDECRNDEMETSWEAR